MYSFSLLSSFFILIYIGLMTLTHIFGLQLLIVPLCFCSRIFSFHQFFKRRQFPKHHFLHEYVIHLHIFPKFFRRDQYLFSIHYPHHILPGFTDKISLKIKPYYFFKSSDCVNSGASIRLADIQFKS